MYKLKKKPFIQNLFENEILKSNLKKIDGVMKKIRHRFYSIRFRDEILPSEFKHLMYYQNNNQLDKVWQKHV